MKIIWEHMSLNKLEVDFEICFLKLAPVGFLLILGVGVHYIKGSVFFFFPDV